MRIRLILAASFSVLLIAFAAWTRFGPETKMGGELMAVENDISSSYENIYIDPSLESSASTTTENLTNTDIISRQMLVDYLNLSASGGLTSDGVSSIANKYIESIPSIQAGFYSSLNLADIKVVSDIKSNFERYESLVRQIHERYGAEAKLAYPGDAILKSSGNDTYTYFQDLSSVYERMAGEIKTVPVPSSLSSQHLQLINNYTATAKAMGLIAKPNTDPATAVAAVATINDSMDKQSTIINEINQILLKNTI